MPKNTDLAVAELEHRWNTIFSTLEQGGEVPPAQRLRTEGFMEAVVSLGLADSSELQNRMARCYQDTFGTALPGDWREIFPFPQVPGFGRRAPVFPSTSD